MKKLLCALLATMFAFAADAADSALLFKNVTLIDGTGAPPLEKAWVLLIGDRISQISPSKISAPRLSTARVSS